jgi:hypothetical protein
MVVCNRLAGAIHRSSLVPLPGNQFSQQHSGKRFWCRAAMVFWPLKRDTVMITGSMVQAPV